MHTQDMMQTRYERMWNLYEYLLSRRKFVPLGKETAHGVGELGEVSVSLRDREERDVNRPCVDLK